MQNANHQPMPATNLLSAEINGVVFTVSVPSNINMGEPALLQAELHNKSDFAVVWYDRGPYTCYIDLIYSGNTMVQITRTPEQTMMMEEERADFLMSGSSRPIYLKPGERQILIMDLAESRKFKPGFYYLSAYTLYKTNQTRAEIIRVSNMVVYVKID